MRIPWWLFPILLLVAFAAAAALTRFDKDFPFVFAQITIGLVAICVVIPLTGSWVSALYYSLTQQTRSTTVATVGLIIGCLITAPLTMLLGFKLVDMVRKAMS
jgi:hypothetical protein